MPITSSGFRFFRTSASPKSAASHREMVLNMACEQIATSTLWPDKLNRKVMMTDSPTNINR